MFSGPALAIRPTSDAAAAAIPLMAQPGPASGTIACGDMLPCAVPGRAMGEMNGGGVGNHVQHERNLRLASSQMSTKRAPRNHHFPPPGIVGANQGNSTLHDCRPPGGPGVLPGAGEC
jgi:hypothetical protein